MKKSKKTGKQARGDAMHLKSKSGKDPRAAGKAAQSGTGGKEFNQMEGLGHGYNPPEGYQGGLDSPNASCD